MNGCFMKKLFPALIILLLVSVSALAQDNTAKHKAGSMGLIFSLNGLAHLGADNVGGLASDTISGGIGLKYFISPMLAFRVALGFHNHTTTSKPTSTNSSLVDEKKSMLGFAIRPGIEYHIGSVGPISGYLGAEVIFATKSNTIEGVNHAPNTKYEESVTAFGGGAFKGAEWHAWQGVSIGAEYHLQFTNSNYKTKMTSGNTTTEYDSPTVTNIALESASSGNVYISFWQ